MEEKTARLRVGSIVAGDCQWTLGLIAFGVSVNSPGEEKDYCRKRRKKGHLEIQVLRLWIKVEPHFSFSLIPLIQFRPS